MNWPQRLILAGAVIAELIGAIFIVALVYFAGAYVFDTGNPLRHEFLIGVAMALTYAAGALLLASASAGVLRRVLPRLWFRLLCWPGLITGAVFLVFLLGSLARG